MPLQHSEQGLLLRPVLAPRVGCAAYALVMIVLAALCAWVASDKTAALQSATAVQIPPDERWEWVLVIGWMWLYVAVCLMVAGWLSWACTRKSLRMTVSVGQHAVVWRPFFGRTRRAPLAAITSVEDYQPRLGRVRLRIRHGTTGQNSLDIPKHYYLPPDFAALRARIIIPTEPVSGSAAKAGGAPIVESASPNLPS